MSASTSSALVFDPNGHAYLAANGSTGGLVAQFAIGALSANAIGSASGPPPGGNIDHYAIGPDGQLTAVGTTSWTAGRPTAMAIGVQ